MLAMHMADSLLTPPVALVLILLAAGVLALAARQTRERFDPARVPLMGVLGAFVFAAQMINFPILPGTSGHLGGGLLLAIVLGPHAATLVMASILIVQCLIFQDGGLLALGANIINLGVIPCYLGWAVYRLAAGRSAAPRRAYPAVFLATLAGVTAGAALVPIEVRASNLLAVPLSKFLLLMIALHLLIGLVEALVTFGVVAYLAKVRPQLISALSAGAAASRGPGGAAVAGSILVVALLLAGLVSIHASEWPDALESLVASDATPTPAVQNNPSDTVRRVEQWHERVAPLPDYQGIRNWSSASGVIGTLLTLSIVWMAARFLRSRPPAPEGHGFPVQPPSSSES